MPGAPIASRVKRKDTRVQSLQVRRFGRHSLRDGFNGVLRALPGDRALLSPSSAGVAFRRFDSSVEESGPHGFAVRICAVRQRHIGVHHIPLHVS
jgi:hypothetical protein